MCSPVRAVALLFFACALRRAHSLFSESSTEGMAGLNIGTKKGLGHVQDMA